jgi:RND family efflux transporter MFP subunit
MAADAPLTVRELTTSATTLDRGDAVGRALAERPDLAAARADVEIARAMIRKEQAEGRWDASVSVGYMRQDTGFGLNGLTNSGQVRPIQDVFHYFGGGVPGTVASNAYRDTKVNTLVGGIVRHVMVELGARVRRGEPLAVIFSSDLADAQMKYLSMRATFEADHQKLVRTEKLVALGAASRQELEEVTAMHAGHETELAAARQRLLLLGLEARQVGSLTDASHVVSEVTVPAPANGEVIARSVNPGQVVSAGQELFVVTDLSTVWVIGDLYEKDFPVVRVGSNAVINVPANNRTLRGRVAYIDPRVDPASRTAKVRVEVPNPGENLRLGMFVTLSFETASNQRITVVPQAAVQAVGERTVVYMPVEGEEGKFAERPVKLGPSRGDLVQVVEGLRPGEKVVTNGSFFLRSEAARGR